MAYVSGYLLGKSLQKHKCEKCANLADESGDLKVILMFKAYDSNTTIYFFFNDIKQTTGVGKEVDKEVDIPLII